jgi:hypothetical protein
MLGNKRGKQLKELLVIGAFISLVAFPTSSAACSLVACLGNGVEMRRDFVVDVTHGGKPLAGVTVEVRGFGGENNDSKLFSGRTAPDGTVHVGDLPPGEYWLNAELLEITAGSECFHIGSSTSTAAKKRLTYEWGDLAPAVRQIAGRLIDPQPGQDGTPIGNLLHYVDVPISEARLKIQDPLTGAVYYAESDVDGHFSFGRMPTGTYVLHIDGGTEPNGRDYESTDLLVQLSDTAWRDTLVLSRIDGGGGSCGGTYLELRNAPN